MRGVRFELLVLQVHINGLYLLYSSNKKEKNTFLAKGEDTNILWSLPQGRH